MTIFIRDQKNKTILDLEYYIETKDNYSFIEISSSIIIDTYSQFLVNNLNRKDEIIQDFDDLSELRGWLWEVYFMSEKNIGSDEQYSNVLSKLREIIKGVANKYNLYYTED